MSPDPDEPEERPPAGPLDQARRALRAQATPIAEGALLVAAFSWMLWVRLRSLDRMVRDGTVLFTGTDPYYHFRNLQVVLHNFPSSLVFDPWTYFPKGTVSGQFGTLFETLLAGAILLGHGGSVPDVETVRMWAAVYPAVLGALTVIPVYVVVRRATNRVGASYAAVAISFLSGEFLVRSIAGNFDHHVVEALLSASAAAGLLWALHVAERGAVTLEGIWSPFPDSLDELGDRLDDVDRRVAGKVLGAATVAGLLLATYLLTWNYGILFIVIFDLFALLAFGFAVRADRPTDAYTLALVPFFLVAGLVTFAFADVAAFDLHRQSLLQPALLLLSALGVLVLQGLRTLAESSLLEDPRPGGVDLRLAGAPRSAVYGGLVGVAVAVGAGLTALVLPGLFDTLVNGSSWVFGASEGSRVKTIAEARTLGWSGLVEQVSWMAYPAAVAVGVAGWRSWRDADPAPTLFLAWGGLILVATYNQVRFSYYAGVVTVVLNGYLVGELARMTGLAHRVRDALPDFPPPEDGLPDRASTGAQVAAVAAVAVFLLPGLVFATDSPPNQAWEVGTAVGPGESAEWQPSLEWMNENTPAVPGFDLNAAYEEHPGYEDGTYGVLSWWDYGHWIQLTAERPPVANPFQQGAPFASKFFTSTPETSNDLLRDWEGDQRVRYVMIDDAMATGKFGAITVWAERTELNQPSTQRNYTIRNQSVELPVLGEPFEETTLSRLYFEDADGMERYRLVHELTGRDRFRFVGNVLQVTDQGGSLRCLHQTFPSRNCPVQPADQDVLDKIESGEPFRVADLQGNPVGYAWDVSYVSTLKTFERVEGAVLTGEAPAGSNVTARLALDSDGFRGFAYERTTTVPEGTGNVTWEMRVSYASGPPVEGANRTVRAQGPYQVHVEGPDGNVVAQHRVEVADAAVLEGRTVQVGASG